MSTYQQMKKLNHVDLAKRLSDQLAETKLLLSTSQKLNSVLAADANALREKVSKLEGALRAYMGEGK